MVDFFAKRFHSKSQYQIHEKIGIFYNSIIIRVDKTIYENSGFYLHSDFTWNQFVGIQKVQKIAILTFLKLWI